MQRCAIGDRVVDNIRYLRNLKKLTQHELENKAGLSLNYISGIERYNFYPKYNAIELKDKYWRTAVEIKSMFIKFEEKSKELKGVIDKLSISVLA